MSRARTIVSANVICYINNKPYAQVTSFAFHSSTPREAINGVDSIDPFELAVNTTKVSGSIGLVRTLFDGGIEGAGLTTNFERLPQEKYFSVMLVERLSQRVLFRADYCSVNQQNWSLTAKGIMQGQVEFEALAWSNDSAE